MGSIFKRRGIAVYAPLMTVGVLMGLFLFIGHQPGFVFAQGMPPETQMRKMMRRMMKGLVPPPGMYLERLPDPQSIGAKLTARYCAQCHDLPSPRYKTADQWPIVFDRMVQRMTMMSRGGMMQKVDAPSAPEALTLLGYLKDHAMREATSDELAKGTSSGRSIFQKACSQCHALPSPSLFTPDQWPGVVARMEANIHLMNKTQITPGQRDAIVGFLNSASRKAAE